MAALDDGELVTKFLLSTYRLQATQHDVRAVVWSAEAASAYTAEEPEADAISLISGSSAELYIKPMLSCVDDIDIMVHCSTTLAIPAGYPAPTQLPDEFSSHVTAHEIINSEHLGYVYLKRRYLLTKNNDDGQYNTMLFSREQQLYLWSERDADARVRGPATTVDGGLYEPSFDQVPCVRCLCWPPQAADWPTRHRTYGWPDSATVDRVVSNGCDVVHVAHRLCRHDELKSKAQWRLSFSRAEIVLLNSWRPAQQIVYHMLRVFMKTERLTDVTDGVGTKIINNYHIKTLMLWACALKPGSRWNENANVVAICVELLHTLAVWLADSRCPHYFIRNCNLMDTAINPLRIADRLMSVTQSWLSTWFVNNYILKCAQLCPNNIVWLFDDVSTSVKLQNAVSAVVGWRQNTELSDLSEVYENAENYITAVASCWCTSMQSYFCVTDELTKLNLRLSDYMTAVAFLHFATIYTHCHVNIESMDVLSTLFGQSVGRRRHGSEPSSVMLLSQAVNLMKVVENNTRSTVQLTEIELSKAYLYRALQCKDSDNVSIYCLANVYLAVLYYTTGQYQTAIDGCTLVTKSQDHSHCGSHVIQGELLPKIDDNIDKVLGLVVFYQHVRTVALNQKPPVHFVSIFTTELFAHYLLIRCLPAAECHQLAQPTSADKVHYSYRMNISKRRKPFIFDLLLYKSLDVSHTSYHHWTFRRQLEGMSTAELNSSKLAELLQQSAVEHMTKFRQFTARAFRSVCTIVTTDFEAMYAFKRGDYQLCLQLSTKNVRTLLYARRMAGVYVSYPEFIQLLDDDIVSLTALTLIVNPECRDDSYNVGITQLTLSLYLMTQCQLKLRHSATQLAQTLDYITIAYNRHEPSSVLDRLTLKLIHHIAHSATKCLFGLNL